MLEDKWEVGGVVEMAPYLWVRLTKVEETEFGFRYEYELVAPRWTRWQRIKLYFGWRPEIGY